MIEEIIIYTLNNPSWPTPTASSEFYIYLLTIISGIFLIFATTFLIWRYFKWKGTEQNLLSDNEFSDS
jgi:hypothetical protein